MRVLHANNLHRGIGGIARAVEDMVELQRQGGQEADLFARDSRSLAGLRGRFVAFAGGLYARDAVREFRRLLRDRRPDVVHAHELYPLISPWILACCGEAGVPVVMGCYDYRLTCPVATHFSHGAACRRCTGGREHWCVLRDCRDSLPESVAYALRAASARRFRLHERHVARFVACSEHLARHLVEHAGLDAARVAVTPPPVRIPAQPVADPSAGAYVAFAGRFAPEKGVEVLVEACRIARLPLRLAGGASSHPAVRPGDDVAFVTTRSPEELAGFYRGARVLAAPSLFEETFGVVPAEAMSHGVPVVASRIGALPETVGDGGLFAVPGDPSDLAGKLLLVWSDAGLARDLGRAGRSRSLAYDGRRGREALARIYADAAGAPA
jgi:glycosyltransferase involved in cell wall biosynthesis